MDVDVTTLKATATVVDDVSEPTQALVDKVTAAVLQRLAARESAESARRDDAATWSSVRDGRSR